MKTSQLDRAIANLEAERLSLDRAIATLRAQQTAPTKARPRVPRASKGPATNAA